MAKSEEPSKELRVQSEENLLLEPTESHPSIRPPLDLEKEKNSTRVTMFYLVGVLVLLAASITISALSPFWLMGQLSSTISDSRFSSLVEQLKSINSLLGNITSGLLTALGIGIGYFFRRSGGSKD